MNEDIAKLQSQGWPQFQNKTFHLGDLGADQSDIEIQKLGTKNISIQGRQQQIHLNPYNGNLSNRLPPMSPKKGNLASAARKQGKYSSRRANTSRIAHRRNVLSWNGLEVNESIVGGGDSSSSPTHKATAGWMKPRSQGRKFWSVKQTPRRGSPLIFGKTDY